MSLVDGSEDICFSMVWIWDVGFSDHRILKAGVFSGRVKLSIHIGFEIQNNLDLICGKIVHNRIIL